MKMSGKEVVREACGVEVKGKGMAGVLRESVQEDGEEDIWGEWP